jgi:ankyrin repeat protein
LQSRRAAEGASRERSTEFFLADIAHYVYAGDTALHVAAAAFHQPMAALLVAHGGRVSARNRRGAEPLHYAADGNRSMPVRQAETIAYLISIGADPNAVDDSGVVPLHRAVRSRSLAAVRALLDGGADIRRTNTAGSTPLHLAVQPTGRTGSGSPHAREQQAGIVRLLLERGAKITDRDGRSRSVLEAAVGGWIRGVLENVVRNGGADIQVRPPRT